MTAFENNAERFSPKGPYRGKCVVCGAAVRNLNPKTVTCDPTCTKARKAGRTRQEQFQWEMEHDSI